MAEAREEARQGDTDRRSSNKITVAQALEFQSIEEWQDDPRGMNALQATLQVAIPELEGSANPIVFAGKRRSASGTRGASTVPVVVGRAKSSPAPATGAYDVPTTTQTGHFRAAVDSVLAGRVTGADALLNQYGYDVYSVRSSVTNDTLVVFRERAPGGGLDVPRGWGTYIFNTSATARRADIHVNHPISDQHTEDIGADLFQDAFLRTLEAGRRRAERRHHAR